MSEPVPQHVADQINAIGQMLQGKQLYDVIFVLGALLNISIRELPVEHQLDVVGMVVSLMTKGRILSTSEPRTLQ